MSAVFHQQQESTVLEKVFEQVFGEALSGRGILLIDQQSFPIKFAGAGALVAGPAGDFPGRIVVIDIAPVFGR